MTTPTPEPTAKPQPKKNPAKYRANFLWPHADGSIEQAGYEFANARTEPYREQWWKTLCERLRGAE